MSISEKSASMSPLRLWLPVISLTFLGLLFIYSSSGVYASQRFNDEFLFLKKQMFFLFPAILAAFIGQKLNSAVFFKYSKHFFIVTIALCFATMVPGIGRKVLGASRWLQIGSFQFQPSELLKIAFVLQLSKILGEEQLKNLHISDWLTFPLAFLSLLLQPDFGTCVVLFCACAVTLFCSNIKLRYFSAAAAFGILALITLAFASPYRVKRLLSFLDPFADPLGSGFQAIQSLVAIAGGGLIGKGLGNSQQKLFFLPEAHTDFILAVLTEELGLVGILFVLLLFASLFFHLIFLAKTFTSPTHRIFTIGVLGLTSAGFFINSLVVCGLFPTKGLTLPFVSSGGSSLVCHTFAIGLVAGLVFRQKESDKNMSPDINT